MSDAAPPTAGLCDVCRHQQVVRTTRGSAFSLCRRSREEPERFQRYPRIPVTECPGFERPPRSHPPGDSATGSAPAEYPPIAGEPG